LTLAEHLSLVGYSWGLDGPEARGMGLLERFGIGHLAGRFPHELSSGQTQLFTLALTLARPAEVLVLDEPEQRLDPDRLGAVAGLLRELAAAGSTLILATHSVWLIEALADRSVAIGAA
jgi:energy-coupling factor transporter ATP-binding protein EcfA2